MPLNEQIDLKKTKDIDEKKIFQTFILCWKAWSMHSAFFVMHAITVWAVRSGREILRLTFVIVVAYAKGEF